MDPPDDPPRYLTTHEVAALLRIRERKVYELARNAEIPCVRVTGKLLFPRRQVEAWLAAEAAGGAAVAAPDSRPPAIVAGSHDPLLDWAIREAGTGLATFFDGSLDGLARVVGGGAVAAGLHVFEPATASFNVNHVADAAVGRNVVLIEWVRRRQGLLVAPERARTVTGLAGLRGLTVVQRQASAGGAILLRHLLEAEGIAPDDLAWLDGFARTETDAAAAVAAGRADAAPGLESMARQFKLAFVPLLEERFDLLVERRAWFEPGLQALFAFARTPAFAGKAAELGGYDLSGHGAVRWNAP